MPYGDACHGVILRHIVTGNRPPHPQDARWLEDQMWNTITTCWSEQRDLRLDIGAVYRQFCKAEEETAAKAVQIQQFANSNITLEELRGQAGVLLSNRDISRSALGISPEDQTKLVDKLDQVCRDPPFFSQDLGLIAFQKAYPTLDSQNVRYIIALGNLCSATVRLPASAILSEGLDKRGAIAVTSGGLTDIWEGDLRGDRVAIKAFRIYPAQNLKKTKEVSI